MVPFGNLLVIFRLQVSATTLLPDVDEAAIDQLVAQETGVPFHRAEGSWRIAGSIQVLGHAVAFMNPLHPRFSKVTAEQVVWHVIPPFWSSAEPLSF